MYALLSNRKPGFISLLLIVSTFIVRLVTAIALAQSSKGILTGTVTDPSGAVVSGATIRMTNSATGTVRETVSTGDGSYRLDAVDPGNYTVEVSAGGFKSITLTNVPIA